MLWAAIYQAQSGIIALTCMSFSKNTFVHIFHLDISSDVSRTSNISVSSYLRTAAAVQSQDDMGNDLLMGRVDLTPMLDGHVSHFTYHKSLLLF